MVLLLLCFADILIQQALGSLSNELRKPDLNLIRQRLVWWGQLNTKFFFNFCPVFKSKMLLNMSRHRRRNCRSHRAFPNQRLNFGVLNCCLMDLNMGVVVLMNKSLQRLSVKKVHVLRHRIAWFFLCGERYNFLCIIYTKNIQHLPVKLWQVIHLWSLLRQLQRCLILHNSLRHC